jgi:hypothetical protein
MGKITTVYNVALATEVASVAGTPVIPNRVSNKHSSDFQKAVSARTDIVPLATHRLKRKTSHA